MSAAKVATTANAGLKRIQMFLSIRRTQSSFCVFNITSFFSKIEFAPAYLR
jgi:hypothetical protein